MKRLLVLIAVLVALCSIIMPAWAGVKYVKLDSPGPTLDGASWTTAFHKVQDGINAAVSGDEVWVAKGIYLERITLKIGVSLYGGFAGNETALVQRNWRVNITILDAQLSGCVVKASNLQSGRVDGFTIRNGSGAGGGVYCYFSSIVIANNAIIHNVSDSTGVGGIYCCGSSPSIINNTISKNVGAGIGCAYNCTAVIVGNAVTRNTSSSGDGISCSQSSPSIIHNTIAGNASKGIGFYRCTPTIVNNIVAFNASGINTDANSVLSKRNNCVYGNTSGNYIGTSPGINDILQDPMFANSVYDTHIQPNSPCIGGGDNSAVQLDWVDIDGNARTLPLVSGVVDMGADESDGTVYNYAKIPTFSPAEGVYTSPVMVSLLCETDGAIIRYTTDGTLPNETMPGVSSGFQVLINSSTTITAMAWKEGMLASGPKTGYYKITGQVAAPTFTPPAGHYDSVQNISIQCATPSATIRYTTDGSAPTTSSPVFGLPIRVDRGMTVKAAAFLTEWTPSEITTAVYTMRAPTILRVNLNATGIHDGLSWGTAFTSVSQALNVAISGDEIWVAAGKYVGQLDVKSQISLYGGFAGSETVRSQRSWRANVTTLDANGICNVITVAAGATTSTVIDGFEITRSAQCGGLNAVNGIYCDHSSPTISNNLFINNGTAIYAYSGSPSIQNNEIRANSRVAIQCYESQSTIANNLIASNPNGGITFSGTNGSIINNTIVGNTSSPGTFISGVDVNGSSNVVANNIIAFNPKGIYAPPTGVSVKNNCVYGNTIKDYDYITDQTGKNGNIKADPKLANYTCDSHIQPDSPCRNAGSNVYVQANWYDIDGQLRILPSGGTVDIGADESDGTVHVVVDKPLFAPNTGPLFTAGSVTITCSTSGADIHYTTNGAEPTITDSVIASGGSVFVDRTLVLKARAWKQGLIESFTSTANYWITGYEPMPVFSYESGEYERGIYVTISCNDSEASIRYTMNGQDPQATDTLYVQGTPVYVGKTCTLKAKAFRQDWGPSSTASANYSFPPARIIHVNCSPVAGVRDGQSWATAYGSISDALTSNVSDDEIWVAQGIYVERITLAPDVALYGGFAGNETSSEERDSQRYTTVIDGDSGGSVVTAGVCVSPSTVIDGFVLRNGKAEKGGGIYCANASPTVSHNVITNCTATSQGGGIYCYKALPAIRQNTITECISIFNGAGVYLDSCPGGALFGNKLTRNKANQGGAIYCSSTAGTTTTAIANNSISENTAGSGSAIYLACNGIIKISNNNICNNGWSSAIYMPSSSALLCNNTLVGNMTAIQGYSSQPLLNNLIAYNQIGIYLGAYNWVVRNNCVFGNVSNYTQYADRTGTNGNISVDPKLASSAYGDFHIQPDSPCINVGDDSVLLGGDLDIDGQPRVQGAHIDIGADESDLTLWNHVPTTVRVSPDGNDSNDGSTWELARKTVQSAVDSVSVTGGEVWVKAGRYSELIKLHPYTYLFGGFNGCETSVSQRDWNTNETVLDGQQLDTVVTLESGYLTSTIDGFTITNGKASSGGGGICLAAPSIVRNNTIIGNEAPGAYGGGIYGVGLCQLLSNKIVDNTAQNGGGIHLYGGGAVTVANNVISGNSAIAKGGGVILRSYSSGLFTNNLVTKNTAANGGGIYLEGSEPVLALNTIVENNATDGGGVGCLVYTGYLPKLMNNIVAFNSSGVYGVPYSAESTNNCVYGNNAYAYMYGRPIGPSDITVDPLFAKRTSCDYHILPGSPCIDAADTSVVSDTDLDGTPRPKDGDGNGTSILDIGCYEAPANYATVATTKSRADNLPVGISNSIVTAVMPGRFYVETQDRMSAIGVLGSVSGVGKRATVEGNLTTIDGERLISATSIMANGSVAIPAPWFMNANAIGGGQLGLQAGVSDWRLITGLNGQGEPVATRQMTTVGGANNIGLLIKTVGRVSDADSECFYIDDSGLFDDGRENVKGIKVLRLTTISYNPQPGDFVLVTGISSCFEMNGSVGHYARLIRPVSVELLRAAD